MTIEQKTPEGQALGPTKFKGHKIVTIANILHYAPNTVLKALLVYLILITSLHFTGQETEAQQGGVI